MKKIMFNDRYGLTGMVIDGLKTVTRRLADPSGKYQKIELFQPCLEMDLGLYGYTDDDGWEEIKPRYKVGEVVAVAQSYESAFLLKPDLTYACNLLGAKGVGLVDIIYKAGCWNKMFARADLMPHRIRITDISCERLQDITDGDCMREGIGFIPNIGKHYFEGTDRDEGFYFDTPREAFASLIDKVSGRGTWARDPWVIVYEFELVK